MSAHKSINKKDNGIFNLCNLEEDLRVALRNLLQTLPCHKNMFLDFESNVHFFYFNFGIKFRHIFSSIKPQITIQ